MKRKTACIFLLSLFLLCGCGKEEVNDSHSDNTYTYDGQEELITSNYDTWKFDEYTPSWFYAYTDMDHNGRLEVISAVNEGTGLYTYANCYEVNEDLTGLVKIATDLQEGDSWPDIIEDDAECYYDESSGRYYYVYEDILRVSPAEGHVYKYALSLQDGRIERTLIASKKTISDNNGQTDYYFDASGNEINENDYNLSVENAFSKMVKGHASFVWVQVENDIPREPSLVFAEDMYDGYGYVHQLCDQTGTYDFAQINSDGVTWEVYILDEEFNDAERFIPQAYPCALKGNGSLTINEGQWIYVYCPCNSWTMTEAPEKCAFSWGLNPNA